MQPIDLSDKRPRHVQVAASIRAAILTGELEPGQQLPSGQELADFFGISRVTVLSAIRTLREEGFVRSRSGSGVYVRDQASLPGPEDGEHPLAGMATFLFEMGHLKNLPRAGWLFLGIPKPESVAEHSFRVGIVGLVLAAMDGADVGRGCLHQCRVPPVGVGRACVGRACVRRACIRRKCCLAGRCLARDCARRGSVVRGRVQRCCQVSGEGRLRG